MAAYSIISENNAAQYYPDYAYNPPVLTPNHKIYSDSIISRFLSEIGEDERIAFLNDWNEKRNHREKIYISYDSTNKNCEAGDVEKAEYGHPKEDAGAPIVNYAMACFGLSRKNMRSIVNTRQHGKDIDRNTFVAFIRNDENRPNLSEMG